MGLLWEPARFGRRTITLPVCQCGVNAYLRPAVGYVCATSYNAHTMKRLIAYTFVIPVILAAGMWTPRAQNPAPTAPAQFPPLGTGVSADEARTLQTAVDELAAKIAALKLQYRPDHWPTASRTSRSISMRSGVR